MDKEYLRLIEKLIKGEATESDKEKIKVFQEKISNHFKITRNI